jgi:hypothetical protein
MKSLLPIFPTYADPAKWRPPSSRVKPIGDEWKVLRQKVMEREDFTCQYCGYRAEKYQIAHHMDEDPENNSMENLSVICQMCNVIMHAGQGCVVQGVVDLYKESKYSQREVIQITRRMRFEEGKSDDEIIAFLCLRKKTPFKMDKTYLEGLFGFVTSRPSIEQDNMYENWRRYESDRTHSR